MKRRLLAVLWLVSGLQSTSAQDQLSGKRSIDATVPIASLNSISKIEGERRTVQGVLTRIDDPMFLQDGSGATRVESSSAPSTLRIGDEVQVTGTVMRGLFGAHLADASVTLLGPSVPYPPLAITASMAASGRYQHRFIVTDGILLEGGPNHAKSQLFFERGHQRFVAELPSSNHAELLPHLAIGSTVRVRGVCLMAGSKLPLVPFRILLRSAEDLEQIAAPPFWTRGHLIALFALLLLCAYLGHHFYLRLERWRFRLILHERARVAHDLHDTLAQSFAGIRFQLQALRQISPSHDERMMSYLDLAISMVSHSHEDARRAIAMLKPADLDTGNLVDNLRLQGEQLTQGGSLRFQVWTSGERQPLSREAEQVLLRIGHEAVTNAISHANAAEIVIELNYRPEQIELVVRDDGVGFAYDRSLGVDGTPLHGYGIPGMRARTRAIGGSFYMRSSMASGTAVCATIPVRTSSGSGVLLAAVKERLQQWRVGA